MRMSDNMKNCNECIRRFDCELVDLLDAESCSVFVREIDGLRAGATEEKLE